MNNRLSNYKRKNNLKPKERDNGKENLKIRIIQIIQVI